MGNFLISLFAMLPLLACSLIFVFLLMSDVWYFAMKQKNAALVDVAWSGSFGAIAIFYALAASGAPIRRFAIALMVACWSFRLAIHLWQRMKRTHGEEDPRYAEMRTKWGDKAEQNFFGMFQFQALTVLILSTPFLIATSDHAEKLRINEYIGILLFIISFIGEAIADQQLNDFKSNEANHGDVCDVGLWKYSRHPNYFFEWLIWCSFFVFAMESPFGTWTIACPILMLLFLTKMSGIPLAEKQSLASKGEKYIAYQKRTSPFIPWFPRKN
ncbi:MAG: DUF1295 domain-containing protein [Cyanobacteria bacterium SZAS LIN-5]|nr:DUF1295 domain-containing protein [Cyanobacteria bacterium SZAS LIN-5]RTL44613.1 MAG: DUF1295 domain-containing protein [Candidatus Melainabacteria bacterium]